MLEEYRQRSFVSSFQGKSLLEPINTSLHMTLTNEGITELCEYSEALPNRKSLDAGCEYTEDKTGRRYYETYATPFSKSGVSVKASPRYFINPSQSIGAQVATLRTARPAKREPRKDLFNNVMMNCPSKMTQKNRTASEVAL